VKWKGLPVSDASWETPRNIRQFQQAIEDYQKKDGAEDGASLGGGVCSTLPC